MCGTSRSPPLCRRPLRHRWRCEARSGRNQVALSTATRGIGEGGGSSLVAYPVGLVGAGYGQQSDVQGGLQGSEAWEEEMQTGRGPTVTSRLQAPESSRTICSGQLEEKTREPGTTEAPLQTLEEQWSHDGELAQQIENMQANHATTTSCETQGVQI